jgi:sporulation-control protein spo0M
MSFLDKMKAAAGVGGTTIQADVSQRPGRRGEELVAVVRVTGGKVAQKVNYVVVTVEWEGDWSYKSADGVDIEVRGGKGYVLLDKPAQTQGAMLQPGGTMELPLRVKIPSDAPLSGSTVKWKFYARVDIEGANDPEFATPLDIKG